MLRHTMNAAFDLEIRDWAKRYQEQQDGAYRAGSLRHSTIPFLMDDYAHASSSPHTSIWLPLASDGVLAYTPRREYSIAFTCTSKVLSARQSTIR